MTGTTRHGPRLDGGYTSRTVQFLSEQWVKAVRDGLNASDDFRAAAAGQSAKIQQAVTRPDGQLLKYWLTVDDGTIDMGVGDLESPDVTISQDYDTAVALAKSELSPVAAFMSGRLQVSNLMKVMGLQAAFGQLPRVLATLDVEY